MMKQTGYSCIEITTGAEIASRSDLPMTASRPDNRRGRIATFDTVGQEAGGYKLVERWEVEAPNRYYTEGTRVISFDGTKVIVDRNWVFMGLLGAVSSAKRAIKRSAQQRILAAYPEWKQRNMIASAVSLQDVWRKSGKWTASEQATADALDAAWAKVSAVRTHSDTLEAEIDALAVAAGTDEARATAIAEWKSHDWPGV